MITITHDIDFCAENFTRVIALSQGKILLDGKANEVLGQEEILAITYVEPPQLTRLGKRLGFRNTVRTQDEFLTELKRPGLKPAFRPYKRPIHHNPNLARIPVYRSHR